MTSWAIDVRAHPAHRERVGAWLVARTGHAVEEREDGTLVTFAEDERAADALIAALASEEPAPVGTARRPLAPVDWSTRWRDGLGARRFDRLTVVPSWVVGPEADREPLVVLDPETAFGRRWKPRTSGPRSRRRGSRSATRSWTPAGGR